MVSFFIYTLMIKNWLQFIGESQQLELFKDEGIFPYTEEDIIDYLLELEDNKYFIDVRFGWLDKDNRFTQKVESYVEEPCIGVEINSGSLTKSEDVTSAVTSFIKRVSKKAKAVTKLIKAVALKSNPKKCKSAPSFGKRNPKYKAKMAGINVIIE